MSDQPATEPMFWVADCFFAHEEKGEDCHTIHFRYELKPGEKVDRAVAEAVAWIKNRQECLPEWFGMLLALKVYAFRPQSIRKDGSYQGNVGALGWWEWKYDHGRPLPERKDYI